MPGERVRGVRDSMREQRRQGRGQRARPTAGGPEVVNARWLIKAFVAMVLLALCAGT